MVAPLSPAVTSPQIAPFGRNLGGEVIVVVDRLDGQCVRHVHLMSNEEIGHEVLHAYGIVQTTATIEVGKEIGAYFVKASGPCKLVWNVNAAADGKFRRLVAWSLVGCDSVREAMRGAARDFERIFGFAPKYVFMRKLPRGTENCMDVDGMILLEAEWMLETCVAVGGRR